MSVQTAARRNAFAARVAAVDCRRGDHRACVAARRHLDAGMASGLAPHVTEWDGLARMPRMEDDVQALSRYALPVLREAYRATVDAASILQEQGRMTDADRGRIAAHLSRITEAAKIATAVEAHRERTCTGYYGD